MRLWLVTFLILALTPTLAFADYGFAAGGARESITFAGKTHTVETLAAEVLRDTDPTKNYGYTFLGSIGGEGIKVAKLGVLYWRKISVDKSMRWKAGFVVETWDTTLLEEAEQDEPGWVVGPRVGVQFPSFTDGFNLEMGGFAAWRVAGGFEEARHDGIYLQLVTPQGGES